MPNKKIFIILSILLIVVSVTFIAVDFMNKEKTEKTSTAETPIQKLEEKEIKPQEIFSIKEVILSTDKQTYNPNEEIKITAIIKNPFPEAKKWQVVYYFMSEDEKSFSALGQVKELEMKPGQTEKVEFSSKVEQNLSPGDYKIKLKVIEQDQEICIKTKMIKIQGTDKILSAEIQTCEDINCQTEKSVFLQNETIYLKVNSEVSDLDINGTIKYPNQNEIQNLNFENNIAQISANQIGSYKIVVNIKKDAYQSLIRQKDFAVIKEIPEIK
ncbi:hypothetical protein KAI92_03240 [Candidatus Parcubacteria bacterium]|nr:hypothetical protein [Candidatus Parcubacteria bacterium]